MDAFAGRPVWHASIASTLDGGGGVPARLSRNERRIARALGEWLLAGVGCAPDRVDITSSRVVHVRRSLSDAEIAGLDPEWLAIEPWDTAGSSGPGLLGD